jgi:hypothetical protein
VDFDDIIAGLTPPPSQEPDKPVVLDYLGGYRDAVAFTRALAGGDGDGAVAIYESSGSELMCALATLLDDTIHGLCRQLDVDPDDFYTSLIASIEAKLGGQAEQ